MTNSSSTLCEADRGVWSRRCGLSLKSGPHQGMAFEPVEDCRNGKKETLRERVRHEDAAG